MNTETVGGRGEGIKATPKNTPSDVFLNEAVHGPRECLLSRRPGPWTCCNNGNVLSLRSVVQLLLEVSGSC